MSYSSPPIHVQRVPIDRAVRRAMVNELPESLRRLYRRILIETLREGVPVCPDALAVLFSALDESAEDPLHIRCELVERLLWFEIASFCESNNLAVPAGCADALFATLAIGVGESGSGLRVEDPEAAFGVLAELSSVVASAATLAKL